MSNEILEWIHKVLGNLVQNFNINQTYADNNDPWSGILAAASFSVLSTTNSLKGYRLVQLIFFRDMIISIKHTVDWELIFSKIRRKLIKITSAKIETKLTTTIKLEIKSCSITTLHTSMKFYIRDHLLQNSVLSMPRSHYSLVQQKLGIIYIKLSNINLTQTLKRLTPKICVTTSTYELPVIYFYIYIKLWKKLYHRMRMATFAIDEYRPFT